MSKTPPSKSSILGEDGESTSSDESSSSESSVSGEAERRSSEEKPTQAADTKQEQSISGKRKRKIPLYKVNETEVKGCLNKGYRDLLNSAIEETAGTSTLDSDQLYSSDIRGIHWTAKEKKAFFHALSTKGPDDLPEIARAIGTKGEVAVQAYLLELQRSSQFSAPVNLLQDVPATYEIGERCEAALDLTAAALRKEVFKNEIESEREKFGDSWLIDEDLAAHIEKQQDEKGPSAIVDDAESEPQSSEDQDSDDESEHDDDAEPMEVSEEVVEDESPPIEIPAGDFLRPAVFLSLSRSLFMNSKADFGSNWSQIDSANDVPTGPAMFHSALDNFHNIAVNFARWIVQATCFQCLSRLRAKSNQNPAVAVTTEDVKAAIDFLELKLDWKKYWAGVPRRCGVEAYSDSKTYKDGRTTAKNGVALTWNEVEKELGFPREDGAPTSMKNEATDGVKEEYREGESLGDTEISDIPEGGDESLDSDSSEDAMNSKEPTKKRKRAVRTSSYEDEEDLHLDFFDTQASHAEERRILKMLRYSVSQSPDPADQDEDLSMNEDPRKRPRLSGRSEWRDKVQYIAAWEQRNRDEDSSLEIENQE